LLITILEVIKTSAESTKPQVKNNPIELSLICLKRELLE